MIASRRIWDDCLKLESWIHLHSAISVYHLEGKVIEMYMSKETAEIRQFCELK